MASSQTAECPNCNATLKVPATSVGARVRCPSCRVPFTIPDEVKEIVRPSRQAMAPRPRMVNRRPDGEDERPRPVLRRPRDDDEDDDRLARDTRRQHDEDDDDGKDRERRPRRRRKSNDNKSPVLALLIGGGVLFALLLIGGVIATVVIINSNKGSSSVAHGGGSPSPAESSTYAKNEAAMKELVDQFTAIADALESVKDRNSAKTAAAKINVACDRLDKLFNEIPTLPSMTKAEEDRLDKKYKADFERATARIKPAAFQAGVNCGGEPDLLAAAARMEQLGKKFQAAGR